VVRRPLWGSGAGFNLLSVNASTSGTSRTSPGGRRAWLDPPSIRICPPRVNGKGNEVARWMSDACPPSAGAMPAGTSASRSRPRPRTAEISVVATHLQMNAEAWPSQDTLARFTGCSTRPVRYHVTELEHAEGSPPEAIAATPEETNDEASSPGAGRRLQPPWRRATVCAVHEIRAGTDLSLDTGSRWLRGRNGRIERTADVPKRS
jgi:hypothetical protein